MLCLIRIPSVKEYKGQRGYSDLKTSMERIFFANNSILFQLKIYCGDVFYAEIKYDGEHFLIHRNHEQEYRYYSRNQNDFTENLSGILNNRINAFFSSSLINCILDVELILYDKIANRYG